MDAGSTQEDPSRGRQRWMVWLGWGLIAVWVVWWGASFARPLPKLYEPRGLSLATPVYSYMGVDFIHNEAGVRTWQAAGSPYPRLVGDPINPHYLPPPLTLYFFAWTLALPPESVVTDAGHVSILSDQVPYPKRAIGVWIVASAGMVGWSVWQAAKGRRGLGLRPLPTVLLTGLALMSYPVIFEVERGNFNVLVLLLIGLGCVWRPRGGGWRWLGAEAVTGVCAGLAAGLKVFPLILLPGLVVLRRYVAAGWMVATVGGVWLALWKLMGHWTYLAKYLSKIQADSIPYPMHSLSLIWHHLWQGTAVGGWSGGMGAVVVMAPLAMVVGGRMFFSPLRDRLAFAFLLWLAALATYAMMISVDYNLLLLIVATMAVWDWRDPWWVQAALVPWVLVMQPFLLVPEGYLNAPWFCAVFLGMKVWSVVAVGGVILWRARGKGGVNHGPEVVDGGA